MNMNKVIDIVDPFMWLLITMLATLVYVIVSL
jgi:hypothetical protein